MKVKRKDIETALIESGMNASLKGFEYIVNAVIKVSSLKNKADIRWTDLYENIGKEYEASGVSVERSIRYALQRTRENLWDYDKTQKYIGLNHYSPSASIMNLYFVLSSKVA